MATKAVALPKKRRGRPPKTSGWQALLQSSWTKVFSIIVTLGAVAGVFWAADQHWVNFLFHKQSQELTLSKSTDYAKQLDINNEKKLSEFAVTIERIQRNAEIKAIQDQVIFLMKQEMSMKEAMAKIVATNRHVSDDFKAKLAEVVSEREATQEELKRLMQSR